MKNLRHRHIPALIFWLIVIIMTLITMPDVSGIVRDKGALSLPKTKRVKLPQTLKRKPTIIRRFALMHWFSTIVTKN